MCAARLRGSSTAGRCPHPPLLPLSSASRTGPFVGVWGNEWRLRRVRGRGAVLWGGGARMGGGVGWLVVGSGPRAPSQGMHRYHGRVLILPVLPATTMRLHAVWHYACARPHPHWQLCDPERLCGGVVLVLSVLPPCHPATPVPGHLSPPPQLLQEPRIRPDAVCHGSAQGSACREGEGCFGARARACLCDCV
jgi:hypothetical protein